MDVMAIKKEKMNIKNCILFLLFYLNKNSDTLSISHYHESKLQLVLFCFMTYMQNATGELIF